MEATLDSAYFALLPTLTRLLSLFRFEPTATITIQNSNVKPAFDTQVMGIWGGSITANVLPRQPHSGKSKDAPAWPDVARRAETL